ncbi:Protein translocase subunit SecA [Trichinella pseudospiralis]
MYVDDLVMSCVALVLHWQRDWQEKLPDCWRIRSPVLERPRSRPSLRQRHFEDGIARLRGRLWESVQCRSPSGDEIKSGPDQVPELAAFACCITHGGASVRTAVGLRQLRVGNGHQEVRLLEQQHPYSVLDEGRLLTVEALRCQLSEGDPGTVISRQNLVVVWIKVDPGGRNILAGPDGQWGQGRRGCVKGRLKISFSDRRSSTRLGKAATRSCLRFIYKVRLPAVLRRTVSEQTRVAIRSKWTHTQRVT